MYFSLCGTLQVPFPSLTSPLFDCPIKGLQDADIIVCLLDGPGVANSKSDWFNSCIDVYFTTDCGL